MKKLIFTLLIFSVTFFAIAGPSHWNIRSRPTANWLSGSYTDPAWHWMMDMEDLMSAGVSLGTGSIYYVDSGLTTAGAGTSWETAVATIDEAVNLCTANRGDVIMVAQGHAETLVAAGNLVTCDIAGVTIVGIGSGSLSPSITLSDDEAIAFNVDAANVTIKNIYIDATGADGVNTPIDVGATYCTLANIVMLMADGTGQADLGITTSGASGAAAYMKIVDCRLIAPNVGATAGIDLEEVAEGVVISGCYIYGEFSIAAIHNITGKVLTNLLIEKCYLKNDTTGQTSIELISACTGMLVENYYHCDHNAPVDTGACFSFECYGIDDVDESAYVRPVVGTP